MKKWIAILCAVAMLSLLCLTACGTPAETNEATGTESAATDAEEITIGVFGPLTGTMAIGGTRQQDGISYAIEKINANGGLCDGKYTLNAIFEDTEGNSENAVTIMNKFLYKDEVACTMGSNNSPEVLAILDMLTESGTPHIVPSGVNMAITDSGCQWVFRVTATDVVYSKALLDYAVDTLGDSKIAVIYDTNDYGVGGLNLLKGYMEERGMSFVAEEGYTTGTKDFTASLLKIQSAGADAIILWGNYTEGGQIVRQVKEIGIDADILLSTGATIGNFFELAGETATGCYGVSSGFSPARTDEEAVNFIKEFEEAKGYTPDINVVLAYDAVNVLAQAIENCGSSDRTAIRDALREIQDFHAISGTVSFNENGDGGQDCLLFRITDGTTGETEVLAQ